MTWEETDTDVGAKTAPLIFSRLITTPPGLPWDQARIAQLEAARSAPVAMNTLTLRLKRLTRWRHGEGGRYAALYVKTDELGAGFTATAAVDGQAVVAEFKSRAQAEAEARQALVLGVVAGLAFFLCVALAFTVGAVRARAGSDLDALERQAARHLRQAQAVGDLKRQTAALDAIADRGAPLAEVLIDLAWASKSRAVDTPVEAFHWRPDAFGVEVRGDATPFPGSDAQRLGRQLRPGVWLWAKSRDAGSGGMAR